MTTPYETITTLEKLKDGTKFVSAADGYVYQKINAQMSVVLSRDHPAGRGTMAVFGANHPIHKFMEPPQNDEWGNPA